MPVVPPGTRVLHPEWGPGVVARIVNGGRHWIVKLDRLPRTPLSLPAREFQVEGTATGSGTPPPAPRSAVPDPPEEGMTRADARQALEAIRLGVVPPRGLARLTVGREPELRQVRRMVQEKRGMLVLSGGYGAGKTHLIDLAEAEALSAGMLVARATFDPEEVPPSHPLRIYAALINGLRYPQGAGRGLAPLFDRLVGSKPHTEPDGRAEHQWLTPALWAHGRYTGGRLAAELLEWVEGAPVDRENLRQNLYGAGWRGRPPLALPDYRTFGQIMAHLLGGIASWAEDAGWQGLLVLLDEAEYFDHLDTTARGMANNVLRYLAIGALPNSELPFDPEEVYRGGHVVHQRVSPRFRDNQPLAVLCAFTPNPRIDEALPGVVRPHTVLHLEPVPAALFPQLADNVLQLVRDAYPEILAGPTQELQLKKVLVQAWQSGQVTNTRQAARLLIEYWDLYRFDPARAARALQGR